MTAQELFSAKLTDAMTKNPGSIPRVGAVCLFEVTGTGGGEWTVDLASATPSCTAGAHGKADCTVALTHPDFVSVLSKPSTAIQLYFTGRLKITGPPMLAAKAVVVVLSVLGQPGTSSVAEVQRLFALVSSGAAPPKAP